MLEKRGNRTSGLTFPATRLNQALEPNHGKFEFRTRET